MCRCFLCCHVQFFRYVSFRVCCLQTYKTHKTLNKERHKQRHKRHTQNNMKNETPPTTPTKEPPNFLKGLFVSFVYVVCVAYVVCKHITTYKAYETNIDTPPNPIKRNSKVPLRTLFLLRFVSMCRSLCYFTCYYVFSNPKNIKNDI